MEDFNKEKLASLQQKVREGFKDPEQHRDLADLLCERGEWREALLDSALRLSLAVRSAGLVVFQTRGFTRRRQYRRSRNVAEPCATP
jgi:hypothetical protein